MRCFARAQLTLETGLEQNGGKAAGGGGADNMMKRLNKTATR